jgi:ABC-type Zn uptake system ZnuABC Zn-binding protein ZnuA
MSRSALALLGSSVLLLAACGSADPAESDAATAGTGGSAAIIATTTVLGSVVGDVAGCAGGTTQTLMPVGTDPHDFAPSSQQVADLVGADLVVANGLGLEEGLQDALEAAAADGARVLEVAPQLDPLEFGAGGHPDEDEHAGEDEHGSLDPHVWQDVARMATAAEIIGTELADLTGEGAYRDCGTQVHDELMVVDDQVRQILAAVPEDRRVLVTDHDALGYLAAAYGFEVVGTVIPGGSTLAEPSSADLAALAATIEAEGVPAIFTNSASPSTLADAVAAEAGTHVQVVELYVDSLGPSGSGADTFAGMVTTNAQRIADALSG